MQVHRAPDWRALLPLNDWRLRVLRNRPTTVPVVSAFPRFHEVDMAHLPAGPRFRLPIEMKPG